MPIFALETPDMTEDISRPVAMQITRQVAQQAALSNIPIRFAGGGGALTTIGSTLDDRGETTDRLPSDANVSIEVTEEYSEDFISPAVLRAEQQLFFADTELGVYLKPVYQRITGSIEVKYTAADRTSAEVWLRKMKRRASQYLIENLHQIDYHYPVPMEVLIVLKEIHRLRENRAGYGETIGEYLRKNFVKSMTSISDVSGKNPLMVIKEQQSAVVGRYDFTTAPPRPQKENDTGAWSVGFTYYYYYDRCDQVVMNYPVSIHGQLLSVKYRPDTKPYEIEDYFNKRSLSRTALQNFTYEQRLGAAWEQEPGIPIPTFDDWLPSYKMPSSQNVFRVLLSVDDNDPTALLNLTDLGAWKINPMMENYLKSSPVSLLNPYESLFNILVFENDTIYGPDNLMVGANLDVRTITDMNPRKQYHLTLNLLLDVRRLTDAAILRLAKHGQFAQNVITFIDPTCPLPKLLPDGTLVFRDLLKALDYISRDKRNLLPGSERFWANVGSFVIQTFKRSE